MHRKAGTHTFIVQPMGPGSAAHHAATAARCAASGERERGPRAGGGIATAQIHRVPDAVQRPLRCTAEPGPTLSLCNHGPRISSAPRRHCGALRSIRGTGTVTTRRRRNSDGPNTSCPGRGAASFIMHRKAGTHTFIVQPMGPGSAAHHAATVARCAASGARASVREMSQKFNSSVKSRQSGLSFSIRAIFQARRQRFKECSRARASRIESNASK